jgi:hypothetical protein
MTPRRRFILLAAGAAALPRLAFARGIGPRSDAARLTAALADPASAAKLGRAYRMRYPSEAQGEALAALIFASLPRAARGAADLRPLLRARVHADFAEGQVVRLDGWILSRTESRLAALCV